MENSYLCYEDRQMLEALYNNGERLIEIASRLGVHLATIYRELIRGDTGELDQNGRRGYNAEVAQKVFLESMKNRGHKNKAE